MKSVCVFAGSSLGRNISYKETAVQLGEALFQNDYSMVYGGGSVGLMGVIADAVLNSGGKVTGVITRKLKDVEVGHKDLTKLIVVDSMHERKLKMADLSDAIISLPGGVGKWEEVFEALAWTQLGIHSIPIILFNVDNYYKDLYAFAEKACSLGFLPNSTLEDLFLLSSVQEAINTIKNFEPKDNSEWFKRLKE